MENKHMTIIKFSSIVTEETTIYFYSKPNDISNDWVVIVDGIKETFGGDKLILRPATLLNIINNDSEVNHYSVFTREIPNYSSAKIKIK